MKKLKLTLVKPNTLHKIKIQHFAIMLIPIMELNSLISKITNNHFEIISIGLITRLLFASVYL